ncbi:hypothetical protein [Variovorax guangxiensis]|uniref:hypothetical protein n=1 Tax=Variovorax guangxiensis TaxID=1775474 RepID=UPI00112C3735|nr:hypothetical protein [Variovorax guangxiensis]
MSLIDMMTDNAYVEDSKGIRHGPYKTKFGGKVLIIYDQEFGGNEGDFLVQSLPNDREKKHRISEIQYSSGLAGIKPHYQIKLGMEKPLEQPSNSTTTVNISGGNVQVGSHNAQHITASFQTLVTAIEQSTFSEAEKSSAKSKLREFLESPVIAAVAGSAVQAIISTLN